MRNLASLSTGSVFEAKTQRKRWRLCGCLVAFGHLHMHFNPPICHTMYVQVRVLLRRYMLNMEIEREDRGDGEMGEGGEVKF